MRGDANSLLSKLSQKNLRYQQFEDPLVDLELWPVFEALLNDSRLVTTKQSQIDLREAELQVAKHASKAAELRSPEEASRNSTGVPYIFSAYAKSGEKLTNAPPSEGPVLKPGRVDLRSFLADLEGAV